MLKYFVLSGIIVLYSSTALTQPGERLVVENEIFTIKSKILNEERRVLIGEPLYYSTNEQPASVLYLLDGEENFRHVRNTVHGLSETKRAPPLLVVAIVNTDRDRDFLTPSIIGNDQQSAPTAGGADDFARFLQRELMPWVEEKYQVTNYNVLLGHTFGGYFSLYVLLEHPEIFDAYIVSNPATWWGDQAIAKLAGEKFTNNHLQQEKLFISQSNSISYTETLALVEILKQYDEGQLQFSSQYTQDNAFTTMPRSAVIPGTQYAFEDWLLEDPLALFDENGIQGIHDYFKQVDRKYGTKRSTPSATILLLIRQLFAANRLDDVAEFVLSDLTRYPYPPGALNQIASYLQKNGDQTKAIQCYTQALRASPSDPTARQVLTALGVNVEALVDEFAPSKSLLQSFAGKYRMANGNTWEFEVAGRTLTAIFNGKPQALVMQSPTLYVLGFNQVLFEFATNINNNVTSLEVKYDSQKWVPTTKVEQ